MAANSFHEFVKELFAGVGPVQVKRMFGGAGGYRDGLMFLLLADDAIYLKADEALKVELAAEGCGPFIWIPDSGPRAGERVPMGYWRLPDSALDDPDEAAAWGHKALAVAKAKAKSKPKRVKPVAKKKTSAPKAKINVAKKKTKR
jgi:DNA transformation protein